MWQVGGLAAQLHLQTQKERKENAVLYGVTHQCVDDRGTYLL
jgi:hypothetical protein